MHGFSRYEEEMERFHQTRLHEIYPKFVEYLKIQPMPVKSRDLEYQFGLTGSEVREIVKFVRRKSIPIASSGKGYKFARNYDELASTIRHLEERRDSLNFTIARLERAWDKAVPTIEKSGYKDIKDDPDEINDFYLSANV